MYEAVNGVIEKWVTSNALVLFREWNGRENRFTHLTNPKSQTYQIIIDAPSDYDVQVRVRLIEGLDEIDYEACLKGAVDNLAWLLRNALAIAKTGL